MWGELGLVFELLNLKGGKKNAVFLVKLTYIELLICCTCCGVSANAKQVSRNR